MILTNHSAFRVETAAASRPPSSRHLCSLRLCAENESLVRTRKLGFRTSDFVFGAVHTLFTLSHAFRFLRSLVCKGLSTSISSFAFRLSHLEIVHTFLRSSTLFQAIFLGGPSFPSVQVPQISLRAENLVLRTCNLEPSTFNLHPVVGPKHTKTHSYTTTNTGINTDKHQ